MYEFKQDTIKEIFNNHFQSRISHLAAAGSIVNGRSSQSSDLDLLLVLNDRSDEDLDLCRQAVQGLGEFKVDLSLAYLAELPDDPALFQDGPRTCLSLAYISSATFLIGEAEIFKNMLTRIPVTEFRKSILHAVGEYLMRLQGEYFSEDHDTTALQERSFKFLTRTIIDVQLFFSPSDMTPYKSLTKQQILEMGKQDGRIASLIGGLDAAAAARDLIAAIDAIHRYLHANLQDK